jgi:hypothetical protein
MDDAAEKLKTILAQNPNALRESFTNAPEMLEKVVLRLVELSKERPELRQMIRLVLPQIIPLRPVPEDLRQFLKEQPPPLTLTAVRAIAQLFTDDDIRRTVQSVPIDWQKLALTNWVRQELMPEADIRSVFAALGDADESLRSALHRMVRIERNPGGTGRKRERELADTELLLSEDDRLPSERLVTAEDPLRHVCRQETFEQIQRMVTPREWQVTELHLLHGYTFKEIAEMLGMTTSSASTMYYRFCAKVDADPNRLNEFFSETS